MKLANALAAILDNEDDKWLLRPRNCKSFGPAWKGKQMMVSEYVKSWLREDQPPSNNVICVLSCKSTRPGSTNNPEMRAMIRTPRLSRSTIVLHTAFHSTRTILSLHWNRSDRRLKDMEECWMDFKLEPLSGQSRMMKACPMSSSCQEASMCLIHHQGYCHPNIGLRQLQEINHGVRLITMKSDYFGTVDRGRKPQKYQSKQGMWLASTQPQDFKLITLSWRRQDSRYQKIWWFSVRMWSQMMKQAKLKRKSDKQVEKKAWMWKKLNSHHSRTDRQANSANSTSTDLKRKRRIATREIYLWNARLTRSSATVWFGTTSFTMLTGKLNYQHA
jgi:hypothetical protein